MLIIFALKLEAEATLDLLKAKPIPGNKRNLWKDGFVDCYYEFEGGAIALSNVGADAAKNTVLQYGVHHTAIWNAGFAGSLQDTFEIGDLYEVNTVGSVKDRPHLSLNSSGKRLITSDIPIHDEKIRAKLKPDWDLVDMEGYGIVETATQLGINCKLWKIISDFTSQGGSELIRKNRVLLSEKIAEHILKKINEEKNYASSCHPQL